MLELAEKYNRSAGQILLKFQVQRGIIVIPKSQNQKRQSENFDLFSFLLEEADMRSVCDFGVFFLFLKSVSKTDADRASIDLKKSFFLFRTSN